MNMENELVEWFDALMGVPEERERMDRVVALGIQSQGDARVELDLTAKKGGALG
jgi:hypothetical protein